MNIAENYSNKSLVIQDNIKNLKLKQKKLEEDILITKEFKAFLKNEIITNLDLFIICLFYLHCDDMICEKSKYCKYIYIRDIEDKIQNKLIKALIHEAFTNFCYQDSYIEFNGIRILLVEEYEEIEEYECKYYYFLHHQNILKDIVTEILKETKEQLWKIIFFDLFEEYKSYFSNRYLECIDPILKETDYKVYRNTEKSKEFLLKINLTMEMEEQSYGKRN